jgi:hypothetical protein
VDLAGGRVIAPPRPVCRQPCVVLAQLGRDIAPIEDEPGGHVAEEDGERLERSSRDGRGGLGQLAQEALLVGVRAPARMCPAMTMSDDRSPPL